MFNLLTVLIGVAAPVWFVLDTLRSVADGYSPTPFYDQWGTVFEYDAVRAGSRNLWNVLVAQSNEHRLLFPRLVFFADLHFLRGS
ncbi:MAG: hypothetical protein ABW042_02215, partial [Phenylobacterium sp.]